MTHDELLIELQLTNRFKTVDHKSYQAIEQAIGIIRTHKEVIASLTALKPKNADTRLLKQAILSQLNPQPRDKGDDML